MATESGFADWLKQNGFEKYVNTIIEEGGIMDNEGLKEDFDEICEMLLLSNEEKDRFKAAVFATNVPAVDDMQKFCEDCDIVQFKDALIKASYTHPKVLLNKTQGELDNIGKAVGMRLEYLCKFKTVILERQQKIEFEIKKTNKILSHFVMIQVLMKHGIKSKCGLVSKSDSELNELCKKCLIRLGFARSFRNAVRVLQEKSEDNKEQKEKESEADVESNGMNISKRELQREKLELKVQDALKCIGVRLSKMQEKHRVHYRARFENILESLSSGKCKEHFQKLKDILGYMDTQGYVDEKLCGFEVKEVIGGGGGDEETKEEEEEEEQKEMFDICGSVDTAAVTLVQKKLYLVEQTLAMVMENKNNSNEGQINDIFVNQFEHMLRTMKVDLSMFGNEQKRGQIHKHASGFYDDQFIVFTLQQSFGKVD
ncbi:hypothetical protein RFI_03993 [Reticulomyxa filosa]|uniref:Uncharacterized protein n=1 Tax=Reticulomyxa filosa TaxID=46433 RepID=X6P4V5_RETFI|nr:hypothetical protein RFI_03993 [Reticulomyxa filosa]|eukprot:ETO33114.1 hypothetical protein RFI_03993 [Reticulomyxa filosa]